MDVFLQIALSFPTVVYSLLLTLLTIYWLLASTGILDMDSVDLWFAPDSDGLELDGLAGMLVKFGLGGLPVMLVFTVLVLFAWFITYFAVYLVLRHMPFEWVRWLGGAGVLFGAFVLAVPMTSTVLRPVRNMLVKLKPAPSRSFLGQVAVVRSPLVDMRQGIALLEDGGAGLILQVRSHAGGDGQPAFRRGERVVLIEYLEADNAYRVISEDEFQG